MVNYVYKVLLCNFMFLGNGYDIDVFWDVGLYRLLDVYRYSEGTFCLHLQGRKFEFRWRQHILLIHEYFH